MKTKLFLLVAVFALVSCGSTKQQQMQQYPNYGGYQPYPQQGYYQQPVQPVQQYGQQQFLDPTTMQSNATPCERLAHEGWAQGKLRGYGSAESGNRDMARNRAAMNARAEIAASLNALVQSYMTDYNEDIEQDGSFTNSQLFIATQEQVVKEMMAGTAIIFSDTHKNGSRYFYEVCVELDKNKVENAVLNQTAQNGIKMDAAKFREAAQKAWDRLSVEKAGYNPAVAGFQNQQQQILLDQQNQQHQMNMEQQQMQLNQQQQQHQMNMDQQQMQLNQQQQQHQMNMDQQQLQLNRQQQQLQQQQLQQQQMQLQMQQQQQMQQQTQQQQQYIQ